MKISMWAIFKRAWYIILAIFLLAIIETGLHSVSNKDKSSNSSASHKLTLEEINALTFAQDEKFRQVLTRTVKAGQAVRIQPDRFTQSQAHMSLPEIKELIVAHYDIKPYEKIITSMMEREKQHEDYYVFYHGADNAWRIPQDLYTRLYIYFNSLSSQLLKVFVFLRFVDKSNILDVRNFLISQLKKEGLINDHEWANYLLATNLAIFGNVGIPSECTWQYFIKPRGHAKADRQIYEKIMDAFGLKYTYIDALMKLIDLYQTQEQMIVQLFIPKERVDEAGYLSWIRGVPAHKKTIDIILNSVESKMFSKTASAIDHFTQLFKEEQEKNPLFKNLIERVQANDFNLSYFLKFYRNHPERILGINNFQARLLLTSTLILNPLSGVKVFRYSTANPEQLKKYEEQFEILFKKIVSEKIDYH